MIFIIDGKEVNTEAAFHKAISSLFNFSPYYGNNLHALWDTLSTDIERPITLIWKDAAISKVALGSDFDLIVDVLKRVEMQDNKFGWVNKFTFRLE